MSREIQVFQDVKAAISEAGYCADTERLCYAIIVFNEGWLGVLKNDSVERDDIVLEVLIPN